MSKLRILLVFVSLTGISLQLIVVNDIDLSKPMDDLKQSYTSDEIGMNRLITDPSL